MKLQKAQRHQVKLRLGLSGASGFGKTYSALILAYGITNDWSKIALIDTENGSASLYSHLGDFNVLNLEEPFTPERYIEAIAICEQAMVEVIIVDSISHEWSGKGGCLEMHEQLGGRFQDWAKISPRHQAFIDKILQSNAHIITSVRRKIDYAMDADMNGKSKVVKHGTKEITREGFEYELTVNFELINDKHLVRASKDRTGLFMDKPEFIINSNTGKKLIEWCNQGIALSDIVEEINQANTLDELRKLYNKYPSVRTKIHPKIIERKSQIEALLNVVTESIVESNITEQK
ncbi:signal recognition particle subunit FFH/SRP54 (srp54) [Flavobacterium fontis]|uniref:Signal recognition particle subunit FFH/SRP54 (Srp54) n=1 Tax=Flavobacterium fontis TaxID=1124188 RepID=A0A1M4WB77_9FLAO|nr:AAA family ATPase [Flavobacterium fontis]SHE78410.1 signal recognition particle subunit FFH/SRP54 (srp54) [Flavobacterium fontis]